jgi:hypothetical protein
MKYKNSPDLAIPYFNADAPEGGIQADAAVLIHCELEGDLNNRLLSRDGRQINPSSCTR